MGRNVEIKAHAPNLMAVIAKAKEMSGGNERNVMMKTSDVFFNAKDGRLKLRRYFPTGNVEWDLKKRPSDELIFYQRSDQEGPKLSNYSLYKTANSEELKQTLAMAMGIKGEVNKFRHLYMVGQTRVHCDQVEGLGDFMELEVVLREDQTPEEGEKIAHDLMEKLGVSKDNLISGAYMDLILAKQQKS